jgi:hypothetical protein
MAIRKSLLKLEMLPCSKDQVLSQQGRISVRIAKSQALICSSAKRIPNISSAVIVNTYSLRETNMISNATAVIDISAICIGLVNKTRTQ